MQTNSYKKSLKLLLFLVTIIFSCIFSASIRADDSDADEKGAVRLMISYLDVINHDLPSSSKPLKIKYGSKTLSGTSKNFIYLDEDWYTGKKVTILNPPVPDGYELVCDSDKEKVLQFGDFGYQDSKIRLIQYMINVKPIGSTVNLNTCHAPVNVIFPNNQHIYSYTGKPVTPTVQVYLNTTLLRPGKDYILSYQNNTEIGNATITVHGKGIFTGSRQSGFFTILPGSFTPDDNNNQNNTIKKNYEFTYGKSSTYTVTAVNGKQGTVRLKKVSNVSSVTIPKYIKLNGYTFKVTAIASNAFKSCSKLKTLNIQTTNLKAVGKNALKGIYKKAIIKVPKAKYQSYKKLLLNKGQSSLVKIRYTA